MEAAVLSGEMRRSSPVVMIGILALFVVAGAAWAVAMGSPSVSPRFYDDGRDVTDEMPEYTGVASPDGDMELCEDGEPARIPAAGIPSDLPVISMSGERYASMEVAVSESEARLDDEAAAVEEDTEGELTVQLGPEDMFRPDVDALCERFGTESME